MNVTSSSFLRTIPWKSSALFLLGVFFIFTTVGFANDAMEMGRQSVLRLVLSVLFYSLFAILYAVTGVILRKRFWMALVPIFILENVTLSLLAKFLPELPQPVPMTAADIARLHSRFVLDGYAIILGVVLGYACFVYVTIAEFRRYFRVHAEMQLAIEIHHVLVPDIDSRIGGFEFYGRSLPSGDVGGDLIDVFQDDRGWIIAYIADVSGHGVAPGVVMAMVKSAARMQLSSSEKSADLLERLNSVLYPIKKPDMFATFAYLAWNGERLESSLAGHPAILHYHAATNEISEEAACSNMPLGMFAPQPFTSGPVHCAPGDLFLLLTDGLLEVANAKGQEFGLAGVKAVLSAHAGDPLPSIFQSVMDAAKHYGHAADDQSLLLVRCHLRA
jgi:hypothetical protein